LQGDQYSPGIIPLAIKDVFSIIQDVSFPANLANVVEVFVICGVFRNTWLALAIVFQYNTML